MEIYLGKKLPVAAALLLVVGVIVWFHFDQRSEGLVDSVPVYDVERSVRFRFVLNNQTSKPLRDPAVWAYAPVDVTSSQRVRELDYTGMADEGTDEYGNRRLEFNIDYLPPRGTRTVSLKVRMKLASQPNRDTDTRQAGHYLQPESGIVSDDPEIARLSSKLRTDDPIETARAIHEWVAGNIEYSGYLRDARGALYALRERKGDCTEYAMLFTALARANGIPARVLGGYVVEGDAVLRARDYHNWAEFLIDGRWHIADPQKRVFMDQYENYVAFKIITDGDEGRFGSLTEGLNVRML